MDHYYAELIAQAKDEYWSKGEPLPLDLAAKMMEAGLDVETLERKNLNNG